MSRIAAFRFLCACLGGQPLRRLHELSNKPDFSWSVLLTLAHEYHVASALHPILERNGQTNLLPEAAAVFLSGNASHRRLHNERLREGALEVAGILNQIGVVPLFLKGGAHLLAGLYPDPAMRVMADLDILIPGTKVDQCVAVLQEAGFAHSTDYRHPREHHRPPLVREDLPAPIELHHDVMAHPFGSFLETDEIRRSSRLLPVDGLRIAVPSPSLALVHNIAHAQLSDSNYLFGRIDLRGLLDFALITQTCGGELEWQRIDKRFKAYGKKTALNYHLLCASDLLGVAVPGHKDAVARFFYRRAVYQVKWPKALDVSVRALRPWTLLRRELSTSSLRRRLLRNMGDRAWWGRHLNLLLGRRP